MRFPCVVLVFSYHRHFTTSVLGCVDQAPNVLFAQYYAYTRHLQSLLRSHNFANLHSCASLCQSGAVAYDYPLEPDSP
ncbi:hypothetical protein EDD22DRAFT_898767 [Suillus occidentalis]|nr:hypothetical protein EDD22DRAFT_898767 [Suillus occidentalis]